jgi:hypothetical protein
MDDWLAQLRASPSFATRLLPPLASTQVAEAGGPAFERFLSALAAEDRALAVDGLDLLVADYLAFLRDRLPKLLLVLRSLRAGELTEVGPALAGQPVWSRTVLGWASGALPFHRYVSRLPIRSLDLPENTTLRLLLRHLAILAGQIVNRLGPRTHPNVREIARLAETGLKDPAVRAIRDVAGASEQMLRAAEGASDSGYREAGRLLRRRLALSLADDLGRWRRSAYAAALASATLAPTEPEEIFELLALARVLDALERDLALGAPTCFWMRIGSNARSGPIAAFEDRQGSGVEIYFDRTPAFLLNAPTQYSEVFRRHEGLGQAADRRPDIVVVRSRENGARSIFFLEVKLSSEGRGRYLRDSIYKGFGYLYDFAALWPLDQRPKVGIFVPMDAGPREPGGDQLNLSVLSARRPVDLSQALSAALSLPLG